MTSFAYWVLTLTEVKNVVRNLSDTFPVDTSAVALKGIGAVHGTPNLPRITDTGVWIGVITAIECILAAVTVH